MLSASAQSREQGCALTLLCMQWYCERCAAYCQAEYRYMLSLQLEDHTGKEWVTAFQVSYNPPRSHCCPMLPLLGCNSARHACAQNCRPRARGKETSTCKQQAHAQRLPALQFQ